MKTSALHNINIAPARSTYAQNLREANLECNLLALILKYVNCVVLNACICQIYAWINDLIKRAYKNQLNHVILALYFSTFCLPVSKNHSEALAAINYREDVEDWLWPQTKMELQWLKLIRNSTNCIKIMTSWWTLKIRLQRYFIGRCGHG